MPQNRVLNETNAHTQNKSGKPQQFTSGHFQQDPNTDRLFYTNERTDLLLSTDPSGKKLLSNIHGSSCLHKFGWWSNCVDSPGTETQPFPLFPTSKSVAVSDRSWWEMIALLSCLVNCNSFAQKTQTDSLCTSPSQQNWV